MFFMNIFYLGRPVCHMIRGHIRGHILLDYMTGQPATNGSTHMTYGSISNLGYNLYIYINFIYLFLFYLYGQTAKA